MSYTNNIELPSQPGNNIPVVSRMGPRTRDAIIAASTAVAMADGQADPIEHLGLIRFLKGRETLIALGRADSVRRFAKDLRDAMDHEAQAAASRQRSADQWQDLTAILRPFANMHAAGLIAAAAGCVAAADGKIHPRERELLHSVFMALDLEPINPEICA